MSRQIRRAVERAGVKSRSSKRSAKCAVQRADKTANRNIVAKDTASVGNIVAAPIELRFDDLDKRQLRGLELFTEAGMHNEIVTLLTEESTLWRSATKSTTLYRVERQVRNKRGVFVPAYQCQCGDFKVDGRNDCKHVFAEKLRRFEIIVTGIPATRKNSYKMARRRSPRKRFAYDGRTIRSAQRSARQEMPRRVPELLLSARSYLEQFSNDIVIPLRVQNGPGGATGVALTSRALALVAKVAARKSADAMIETYEQLIARGLLPLASAPKPNTLSNWMRDERLTSILTEILRITSLPFRSREIGGIVDSSKLSQKMTAHARDEEYGKSDHPDAYWVKCHAIVGVETMVVMAVRFSTVFGSDTHDSKFLLPLLCEALTIFPLQYLLADKAYLSEPILRSLWDLSIRAAIPLKKNTWTDKNATYHEAIVALTKWFNQTGKGRFEEVYCFRPKIEAFFSLLKRLADGFCWSRGRHHKARKSNEPEIAWKNEMLCKCIYLNLRATVLLEHETGYRIDYSIIERHFPAPSIPLLTSAA